MLYDASPLDGGEHERIFATDAKTAGLAIFRMYLPLAKRVMPTHAPAKNRWGSMGKPHACITFGDLVGRICARGWEAPWPTQEQSRRLRELNHEEADEHDLEKTKRLAGASESWGLQLYVRSTALLNSLHVPVESCLFYLEKVDSDEWTGVPLVYQLHDEYRTPFYWCAKAFCDMLDAGGEIYFLLETYFFEDTGVASLSDAEEIKLWQELAELAMSLSAHAIANLECRLRWQKNEDPVINYKALALKHATPTWKAPDQGALLEAGRDAFYRHHCCSSDHCGVKMQNIATSPEDYYQGILSEGMELSAPLLRFLTDDLERLHKLSRDVLGHSGGRPLALDTFCVKAGNHTWAGLHKALGGSLPRGITTEKLIKAGVNTRARQQHVKELNRAKRGPRPQAIPLRGLYSFETRLRLGKPLSLSGQLRRHQGEAAAKMRRRWQGLHALGGPQH